MTLQGHRKGDEEMEMWLRGQKVNFFTFYPNDEGMRWQTRSHDPDLKEGRQFEIYWRCG